MARGHARPPVGQRLDGSTALSRTCVADVLGGASAGGAAVVGGGLVGRLCTGLPVRPAVVVPVRYVR